MDCGCLGIVEGCGLLVFLRTGGRSWVVGVPSFVRCGCFCLRGLLVFLPSWVVGVPALRVIITHAACGPLESVEGCQFGFLELQSLMNIMLSTTLLWVSGWSLPDWWLVTATVVVKAWQQSYSAFRAAVWDMLVIVLSQGCLPPLTALREGGEGFWWFLPPQGGSHCRTQILWWDGVHVTWCIEYSTVVDPSAAAIREVLV